MKLITPHIQSIAFLIAAMYLFHNGSHNWGWLVLLSILSTPTHPTTPPKKEQNLIKDIENKLNDTNDPQRTMD